MARLIESSVLIEMEHRGQLSTDLFSISGGESLTIASITAAEYLVGAELAPSIRLRRSITHIIEELLEQVVVLPFDLEAARIHARLRAYLRLSGQSIGIFDLLIAATALANDCDVITLNVREFNRIPGLNVIVPDW